jgi:asparagine synthase (glutamine-hydrolysing)
MTDFYISVIIRELNGGAVITQFDIPSHSECFSSNGHVLCIWGDYITPDRSLVHLQPSNINIPHLIQNIYGHFYYCYQDSNEKSIIIGNSLFSILPVYYRKYSDKIVFSNSPIRISSDRTISKRFILENLLFNYPLFNNSTYDDVFLLKTNHSIKIDVHGEQQIQHTAIEDLFVSNPKSWRKSLNDVADQFIHASEKYYPDKPFTCSLTGGFDGRTLTACGLYHNKKFGVYSFGNQESDDVVIAEKLAELADIQFSHVELLKEYVNDHSLRCGHEFIIGASGGASFARAHYLYSAKLLAENSAYLVTGNFGSEILRAFHVAGVVINANLYHVFNALSYDHMLEILFNAPELKWLNVNTFKLEWESLVEDLKLLPCYDPNYAEMTKSEKFYVFIFNEVFRKYFGAEMVNQFKYLPNRTPFLDFQFLKAILQTEVAGVYSDFYEHNPLKRYKGQVLYGHIIRKTYPSFGEIKTDKGYRPNDLITTCGKVNIAQSYFRKRMNKTKTTLDPYSVDSAFAKNLPFYKSLIVSEELFNSKSIFDSLAVVKTRDSFFIALSQVFWVNYLKNAVYVKS